MRFMVVPEPAAEGADLLPYVPRLLRSWPGGEDDRHLRVPGTLAFVDISGFTRLTERLARKGKVGAEELSDLLSSTFAELLAESYDEGADLVKWGGDAMLLLFRGAAHAPRAARAVHRMRTRLRTIGHISTGSGPVTLRMSAGIHSGDFDFFLVGDPGIHRELLISGPAATVTAETEAVAEAGQIGLSATTAALLDPRHLGKGLLDGRLLRSAPGSAPDLPVDASTAGGPSGEQVLPPPILRVLRGGAVEAEHRLIVVGFVQYSGTDSLLATAGAGALTEALDELVRNVQEACAHHDVTFFETDINSDGGKIMLTAGAPFSAEHAEERMLRVGRQVIDRAGRLAVRIGVNRGHVFSGDFGAPFRRTYSVKGDAINLAARVMGKAGSGELLATLEVLRHSHAVFRTTELAPFTVKGKTHPVRAATVGHLETARADVGPGAPVRGRAGELAVLRSLVAQAQLGHGQYVEVVGEAGMGKSSLLTEALAAGDGLRVVAATCHEYESATPYFPFRRLLRELFEVDEGAVAARVVDAVTRRVAEAAPHLLPWLPLLGVPLDLPWPGTPSTTDLDEQFRKERLEQLVSDLVRVVPTAPTVLVLEDTHLMDDASVDLLRTVSEHLDGHRLVVVVTGRQFRDALVPRTGTPLTRLELEALGASEALDLVHSWTREHPLTAQAASELVARAGGNPMFLRALVSEAGRAGSPGQLPESVEGLVTSQIDRLDPRDRTVVRYAAVFGTVVDEKALDLLLAQHEAEVPAGAMMRLGDFLERDARGGLRFRNALVRDVAYEALPYRRRKVLHEHVGQAIERSSASPDSQCELLSLHFFHAGRHERAWRYSVLAGERASAKYAHGDAIRFFARAAQSAAHEDVDPRELAHVHEQLADSRWLAGLIHEAADAYAAARACLRDDPVRLAGIIEKEARIEQRRRRHSLAMRRITTGLRRLENLPGPEAAIARSLLARRYAHSKFSQNRVTEALRWADVAAFEAEEAADKDALAQAYEMLNFVYASSQRDEPLPYGRLALQAYVELGNLPRQGHCLNNLAMQEYAHGHWDASLTHLREAGDIFRRIGDTAAEANAMYNQVELLVRQRRPVDAQALLPEVLRTARAVEDVELVGLALREQARVAALTGDVVGAVSLLDEAHDVFVELEEHDEVRSTAVARAEVLLDAGLTEDAGWVLSAVLDAADPPHATLSRLVGRHRLAEGRLEEARTMLEAGLAAAEGEGNRYEEALILLALAALTPPSEPSRALTLLDTMGVRTAPAVELVDD